MAVSGLFVRHVHNCEVRPSIIYPQLQELAAHLVTVFPMAFSMHFFSLLLFDKTLRSEVVCFSRGFLHSCTDRLNHCSHVFKIFDVLLRVSLLLCGVKQYVLHLPFHLTSLIQELSGPSSLGKTTALLLTYAPHRAGAVCFHGRPPGSRRTLYGFLFLFPKTLVDHQ